MPPKRAKPPAPKAPDTRPVHQRGQEHQAEKLTGNRAQKGNLPGGAPRWTYEVKWCGVDPASKMPWKNTWEPAACLVGWEKEMKEVDAAVARRALLPVINPFVEAQKQREVKAKAKAEELQKRRARLERLQRRRNRAGNDAASEDGDAEDDEDPSGDEATQEEDALDEEALRSELARLQEQLKMFGGSAAASAAAAAAAAGMAAESDEGLQVVCGTSQGQHKRAARSKVWKAFNRETNRCMLPHPKDKTRTCNSLPDRGTGTSGHIGHLEREHHEDWLHIKVTGERKSNTAIISDALAAKVDTSVPALRKEDADELDRLTARWIAKCDRPKSIVQDEELRQLLARILQLCKARFRYELPCANTVDAHLQLLGAEGKAVAREFLVSLLVSGVKVGSYPSQAISGLKTGWASSASMLTGCLTLSRWRSA